MNLFRFMKTFYLAYKVAESNGVGYCTVSSYGVPATTILVGRGRAAWEVSNLAANYFLGRRERTKIVADFR